MSSQVRVTNASGIRAAVEFVEQYVASVPDHPGMQICPLICEELLLRMLDSGCGEIYVSLKGFPFRYVEIRAEGDRTDVLHTRPGTEKDEIGAQINGCLLEQYADYYTFRYQNGVNLYRVDARKRNSFDLTEEIYGFYGDADPAKPHRPTDVLRSIARRHKGFIALSVLIHLLKHLGALMLPVFISNIINIVTETGSFFNGSVYLNILMSLVSLSVNLICYWLDSRYYRRFTRAVEAGFRMALVQKLQVLSIRFHSGTQSGVVLSKLVSDVQFIQMLIYDRFQEVLYLCEDVVFIIVVALMKFPPMLAFYIVIVPTVVFLLRRFTGPMQDKRAGMRQQNEQVGAAVKEMLEMEGLNRAHGLAKTEYRSILTKVRGAQRAAVLYDRQTVSVNNITYGVFQGLRLVSLSFAALLTATGHIEVGTLVLFQSIFEMIISNVQRMLDAVPMITQGYDSLKSVSEILYAGDLERNGTALLPSPVQGGIEFRQVTFGYAEDQEPVLKEISFSVPPRGSIAFVGKSGEGKTTILNLILGLYSPREGEVLIDGVNLETLEKTAYRHHIAVVPQQTVLFSGTLWDNLVYGLNYVSTETVMDVIRRVGLEDLVESLPEGLNTPILESGGNLSGGQRQRISIARALLRKPKIILLDEATSALDTASEQQVQEAIDAMMGSCTVIMVAHRLNTLRRAEIICRIDRGRISRYEDFEQVIRDMEGEDAV
jgi:ATP-binding cassette subfamily B protein